MCNHVLLSLYLKVNSLIDFMFGLFVLLIPEICITVLLFVLAANKLYKLFICGHNILHPINVEQRFLTHIS